MARADIRRRRRLRLLAEGAGRTLNSLAFGWLLHHTTTDVVILGASRIEQLVQNLEACSEGALDASVVKECDEIWKDLRGPLPVYNR